LGQHLDLAAAKIEGGLRRLDLAGEGPVDGVPLQEMSVGLDRAEIVDRHDLDVLAAGLRDSAKYETPDPTESVNRNADCHFSVLLTMVQAPRQAFAAAAAASGVMLK